MFRAAICDDNERDLIHIRMLLQSCGIPLSIGEYRNAENLLWDVETDKARFDFYLLDIYLKEINGVEAARRIRAADEQAVLIFITSSREFYQEAFDVYAFHYLTKPVKQEVLTAVMEKAADRVQGRREMVLPVTYRGKTALLRHDQIEYISSSNRMLCFHLRGGGKRECYGKLDEIAARLKEGTFVRCHQSYIVNLRYVLDRVQEGFRMEDMIVPISRSYCEEAGRALNEYLFGIFESN